MKVHFFFNKTFSFLSSDPQLWTTTQVHAWIRSTIEQFKLSPIDNLELKFPENGANLLYLSEEEFVQRVPEVNFISLLLL